MTHDYDRRVPRSHGSTCYMGCTTKSMKERCTSKAGMMCVCVCVCGVCVCVCGVCVCVCVNEMPMAR